ncbi:MAG: low specificity L-threonine aldolase [Gluconobacter potus]|uniref:L-threonine aldolase n=1 Tax=Gluconobacter potus TaxID=2724927 RepID=A0ABR9YIR9_9PROT|nr:MULTISPECIES: low specificity L-threonine aldolase [Gluconobacter]MBF0863362.1 low specificity L-threonine aldolase [Gluconobacter sp. R71656]MBF0867516.1 low specificity L-threonine aldolase [Gluconobacter sp. R75628]MBF0873686.1 low specificity L-threonine aldolase [Gluconobacter sp. R75629]MBF0881670.1 low specificity L-threonine aldolase [Gluconobacter potus]
MTAQQFASDNYAGICPAAFNAMMEANSGSAVSYGQDNWTSRAADALRRAFEHDADVYFVFNGTAANSLALASLCRSYESIIAADFAHIETDECGAPEFFSNGAKILTVPTQNGKLSPLAIRTITESRNDIHFPRPAVVTITQPTETGLLYTLDEIQSISTTCRELGLKLHMDGARFANAVAALNCSPADMTWRVGVDVLCCGGTKGGMGIGEAVLFFNRDLARGFDYRCKQAGQLASKMRFLAAPWVGMLQEGRWLDYARHANSSARLLSRLLQDVDGIQLVYPVEANAVFISMPPDVGLKLRSRGWLFYEFIGGAARFMFAWDADRNRIEKLAQDIRECSYSDTGS